MFSTLSEQAGFYVCENESIKEHGTFCRVNPYKINKLNGKLEEENLSSYYQSIFYYLILIKLREYSIQYTSFLERVISIDNNYAYIYKDELSLINKSRVSEDVKIIIENILMIVDHQKDKVTSIIELSSNPLIRKLYELKFDEVFNKLAEYQYTFVEYYSYTNTEFDLSDLSV